MICSQFNESADLLRILRRREKMKKVLIAVDGLRGSRAVLTTFHNSVRKTDEVVLLHVERLEGGSLMIEMLGEAEMSTLKEALRGTEHKEALDRRSDRILAYYRRELEAGGASGVKTLVREGRPAEEILKVAEEEGVELIIVGQTGKRGLDRLITGSVSKEVELNARQPVILAQGPVMCEEPYSWRDAYLAVSVCTVVLLGLFLIGFVLERGAVLP
jgi:nucleotide-binding universal stress UspA family protein